MKSFAMKTTLTDRVVKAAALAAALVVFATGSAGNAAERAKLPSTMLGTWCFDQQTTTDAETWKRGDCNDRPHDWMAIRSDGVDAHEARCNIIASRKTIDRKYNDVFHLKYRCDSGVGTRLTTESVTMWLGKGDTRLVIVRKQRGSEP
jgi:hypothetical protein